MDRRWCDRARPTLTPVVLPSRVPVTVPRLVRDLDAGRAVLQATRAFLRVADRTAAAGILHDVITELGGEVVPALFTESVGARVPPVDVSLGLGVRTEARATADADRRLARHLPGLLEDAVLVADRAEAAAGKQADVLLDPLTGVVSQGQIAARLEAAPQGALVCVLDLDRFKSINDRLGHMAGDATLRRFGNHLRAATRPGDFVARSGGDEFMVIIDDGITMSVAHRRMTELASTWAHAEHQASTVSIGLAGVTGTGPIVAAIAADRAMYRAKRSALTVQIARAGDAIPSADSLANETYDAYLASLAAANPSQAVAALTWGAQQGMSEQDLISDVIGRAQVTVGDRWATGDWGVAQEHAATLVAEQALTLLAPPSPPSVTATRVVMACAEGESHTLALRMAAQLVRTPQLEVIVLDGSMPAVELGSSLRLLRPAVLGLSTTVATNLIGAYRCIQAARQEGIPVLVGGAAWGTTQHRARRLGADAMLRDVGELVAYVGGAILPPAGPIAPLDDEAILLEQPSAALLDAALESWSDRQRSHPTTREGEEARQALEWVARHVAAAVACDDPSVLGDLLESQLRAAHARGSERQSILDVYVALAHSLLPLAPRSAALVLGVSAGMTP